MKKSPYNIFKLLGPGLITGASDDDPSGIATYSQVGAKFGFDMLWTMLISYPMMTAVQEISARIGRITGRGLAGNMRRFYSAWITLPLVALLVAANIFNLGADIIAMGTALIARYRRLGNPLWSSFHDRLAGASNFYAIHQIFELFEVADSCTFCLRSYCLCHSRPLGRSATPYLSSHVFLEPRKPDGNSGSNGNDHKPVSCFSGKHRRRSKRWRRIGTSTH